MCHTQFSVAARQKAHFPGRKQKNIFHRRQKENKRISVPFLTKQFFCAPRRKRLRLPHLARFTRRKRHQNEIFCVGMYYDLTMRRRNVSGVKHLLYHIESSHLPTLWHIKIGMFSMAWSIQRHIFVLISYAFPILNK